MKLTLPPPPILRRYLLLVALSAAMVLIAASVLNWWIPRVIEARGGLFFVVPVELDVPLHRQHDPAWAGDHLGPTLGTLGAEGCAVACASMVLAYHGADVDPGRLNAFVHENDGYTPQGWIYWEAAAEYPPAELMKAYEDRPSYAMIDWNLIRGRPSIVRVRLPSGITHFVVIMGKRGHEYLIRDPAAPEGEEEPIALTRYERPIEALRYYIER